MKIVVAVEVEVKMDEDRANANEVFSAVSKAVMPHRIAAEAR